MINLYPSRFDFMAKYLYIKYKDKNYYTDFFKDLYKAHIITFNGGYEMPDITSKSAFIEKNNVDDFIKVFDKLIDNIKNNGYDNNFPIPMNKNGFIENGTHRLLISYYYNIKPAINFLESGGQHYDYNFFLNRTSFPKLERVYADTMALEYINHNPNLRTMIWFPRAFDPTKIGPFLNIIKEYGYIYYSKQIKLTPNGLLNLIKELYRGEEWIGGLFPTHGGNGKFNLCYAENKPIIYLSIAMNDVSKLIEMKERCRELFNIGKHSLHVSDYVDDTRRINGALLNENSIHFLNNGTNNISENTKLLLTKYFEKHNNYDDILITDINEKIEFIRIYDNDELLYNPNNYYYFNGYKISRKYIIS